MPGLSDRLIHAPVVDRVRKRLSGIGHIGTWDPSPLDRVAARFRRPLDRAFFVRVGALEEQRRLGASVAASRPPAGGPRVLVLSLRAWPAHNVVESVVAQALALRGAEVAIVTCGGGQPKCEMGWARHAKPRPCDRCAWFTDRVAEAAQLKHYRIADHVPWGADATAAPELPSAGDPLDRPEDAHYQRNGFDPAIASYISLAWSLRATRPQLHESGVAAARDYAVAAEGVRAAADAILDDFEPDVVFGLSGLFAAEQVIRGAALERGIRAPTYEGGPRAGHFVLGQEAPAPLADTRALWERVRDRPLTAEQSDRLDEVILGREQGVGAHETYFERTLDDPEALRAHLGIPPGARVASLFSNISFDSAVIGRASPWPQMLDWVEDAVRAAAGIDDLHLVVRVHPGEVRWRSREPVVEALRERIGALPRNVHVIGAHEELSSYALLRVTDLVLTYTSTVGLEAAVRGRVVACAADVHYRGKGFTRDLERREDLRAVLSRTAGRLSDDEVDLARRYAYAFFFRAMVPFPAMERRPSGTVLRMPVDASELEPGADRFVDFVCDRILDGGPFEVPDELLIPAST